MTPKKVNSNEEQRRSQKMSITVGQFEDICTCISNLTDTVNTLSQTIEQIYAFERRDASDINQLFSEIAKLPKKEEKSRPVLHVG